MFDYEVIIANHHRDWYMIEECFSDIEDIATEATPVVTQTNASSTMGLRDKTIGERIKAGVDKVIVMIQNLVAKLSRAIKSFMTTNYGFELELETAKRQTKPLKGIKVIMYNYNNSYLDTIYEKMLRMASSEIFDGSRSLPSDSPYLLPKDQFEAFMIQTLSGKEVEPGTNFSAFLREVKKQYRGQKTEQFVSAQHLTFYEQKSQLNPRLKKVISSDLSTVRNRLRVMKNNADLFHQKEGVDDSQKISEKAYTNAAFFCHCFTTFANWYFNLKFEETYQSRAILKRFYAF